MTRDVHTVLLDPTSEHRPTTRPRVVRPSSLDGLTVGLLDISKPRGDVFLTALETALTSRVPRLRVARYQKPTFAKVAPVDLRHEIATKCDLVIEALAD
jgi:hypothetical protein